MYIFSSPAWISISYSQSNNNNEKRSQEERFKPHILDNPQYQQTKLLKYVFLTFPVGPDNAFIQICDDVLTTRELKDTVVPSPVFRCDW